MHESKSSDAAYEIAVFGLVTIINTINRVTEKQESIALSKADTADNTCALGCKPQNFDGATKHLFLTR